MFCYDGHRSDCTYFVASVYVAKPPTPPWSQSLLYDNPGKASASTKISSFQQPSPAQQLGATSENCCSYLCSQEKNTAGLCSFEFGLVSEALDRYFHSRHPPPSSPPSPHKYLCSLPAYSRLKWYSKNPLFFLTSSLHHYIVVRK